MCVCVLNWIFINPFGVNFATLNGKIAYPVQFSTSDQFSARLKMHCNTPTWFLLNSLQSHDKLNQFFFNSRITLFYNRIKTQNRLYPETRTDHLNLGRDWCWNVHQIDIFLRRNCLFTHLFQCVKMVDSDEWFLWRYVVWQGLFSNRLWSEGKADTYTEVVIQRTWYGG